MFESFLKIEISLSPSFLLAQPNSLWFGPVRHLHFSLSLFFPAAQNQRRRPDSRLLAQSGPAPLLTGARGPPVKAFSYPGSGTDSAESGRTPRRCGLLGPHVKGRRPPLYKQRHAPREPYRDTAAVAALVNPSTAAIDELELGVAARPPFPPLPVDLESSRSFASRWGSSTTRFPPPSRSTSPGSALRRCRSTMRSSAPCSARSSLRRCPRRVRRAARVLLDLNPS